MYDIKRYIKFQLKELDEHKYYLGERLNKEPSIEETVYDWIRSGHAERFRQTYLRHQSTIDNYCNNSCGENCNETCPTTKTLLHILLED